MKISDMMKQYLKIKKQHRDLILFYRLGDFYEMFFEDAIVASRELELTLTGRDCGLSERAPMCGVPHHSVDGYIAKMTEKGYKVGICEQLENPKEVKGIVKRGIVRIITPGTVTEESCLDGKKNNYLCSAYLDDIGVSLVFADVSTGEINVLKTVCEGDLFERILSGFSKYRPREIIINTKINTNKKFIERVKVDFSPVINVNEEAFYNFDNALSKINARFSRDELEKYSLNESIQTMLALYAILDYLEETQKNDLSHMNKFEYYDDMDFADIDLSGRKSLEITETMREGKKKGSLLWILDDTDTSMGARLLRRYTELPLKNELAIVKRHSAVEEIFKENDKRGRLKELLSQVYDIERLCSKIAYKSVNGKELVSLKGSIKLIPEIKKLISTMNSQLIREIYRDMDSLCDLTELIEKSISDKAPATITEGDVIKDGYNAELDKYRKALHHTAEWLAEIESREKERTGIKNLKTGYNKVFGYYIEVTASYLSLVPEDYIRKQTLTNAERYITPELKELEAAVLEATEKGNSLEYQLFVEIRDILFENMLRLQTTAKAVAKLDVFCSLAEVAYKNNYVRPQIETTGKIIIKNGRHPVVEKMLSDGGFVANDTYLDNKDESFAIITGPNMAGKSTYMRQVALICLMSQIGSFVPASSAQLPVVDKFFTRVGASDDLARGQSTFMVEMSEVADILKNATSKSLLILDEIGRGTSTFDGLSIAWSVVEYVINKIGAKTLFATHYHELSILENRLKGVKNYSVAVRKRGEDITFLRKITEGGCDDSFGVEVAKLAGVPNLVLKRAREILKILESKDIAVSEINLKGKAIGDFEDMEEDNQMELSGVVNTDILDELKTMEITSMTPIQAMTVLDDLIKRAKSL